MLVEQRGGGGGGGGAGGGGPVWEAMLETECHVFARAFIFPLYMRISLC